MEMSAKSRAKNRKKQNEITKRLCIWLILNSLLYLVCSPKFVEMNLGEITNYVIEFKEKLNFGYEPQLYAFITFGLISLAAIRILFKAKRIPIVLIGVLLFILRFDDEIVFALGREAIYLSVKMQEYPLSQWMIDCFINSENSIENLNYTISVFIPIYFFLKKNIYDSIAAGIDNVFSKPKSSKKNKKKVSKSSTSNYKPKYSDTTSYVGSSGVNNNYDEEDDGYYYNNKKINSWYESPVEKEKFIIMSEYDKKVAYDMRYTNPNDKIIDESGIERYVWEYANAYENEQIEEEERKRREEYEYYNNNNYSNYSPYEDNEYYSVNNDYYGNNDDYYNNNDYYGNNDDNNGWF